MAWCEIDDLDERFCIHGRRDEEQAARADRQLRAEAATLLISPKGIAHFRGCHHKGDDPDLSRWAEIVTPGAWGRLGLGGSVPATGGAQVGLVATSRCQHCVENDGPWL